MRRSLVLAAPLTAAPVLAVLAFVLAPTPAQADVWTWKDANGEVHYSDQPVEGAVRVKQIAPHSASAPSSFSPGPPPGSKDSLTNLNKAADATRSHSAAELEVQQDLARKQDEQCRQAKATYNDAINARRIQKTNADGGHDLMSDAEADEYRVKARADMDAACAALSDASAVR